MARLVHRQLEDLARAIRAEADWWLARDPATGKTNAEVVSLRANADVDDATKGVDYSAIRRGGQELTLPEQRADHARANPDHGDTVTKRIHKLNGLIRESKAGLRDARNLATKLITTLDHDDLDEVHRIASITTNPARGDCENCGQYCDGTRHDRLITPVTGQEYRAGSIAQCPTCLRYWYRNLKLRPPKLWSIEDDTSVASG